MYFKEFPEFLYDFNVSKDSKTFILKDITRNVRFRKEILENVSIYDEYDIIDGETPEIIAEKFYGNPEYHWIIMLANQKYDYLNDFPLQAVELNKYVINKYNPTLYVNDGDWYFSGGKIYFKVSNSKDAFNPLYLTTSVDFTVNGNVIDGTTSTPFTISETWGDANSGIDYNTQYFWVVTSVNGTPTGGLTITTSGRENNPVYWIDSNGFKVNPLTSGSTSVSGVQYEDEVNESKRRIKIISPNIVSVILKQFKDLL